MNKPSIPTRIQLDIDLEQKGRQIGDLHLKWSDNHRPLGVYPVPIACIANRDGPTILLTGGVHGDEFEGPAALMRLLQNLAAEDINGRIIIIPALNAPALQASSRVSPLDLVNMNRAFPGDADGGPTHMLAQYVEQVLMPECDAVIDLHSGGKASVFAPCVLTQAGTDSEIGDRNMALARAFGAPYIWLSGAHNDDRSLNAAATRNAVPMIAAELGGGGGCDPAMTDFAERALRRCLKHVGIIDNADSGDSADPLLVEFGSSEQNFIAPAAGLLDRKFDIGDAVTVGQAAGFLHFIGEPQRPSMELYFPVSGIVFAYANRGMVERGETIALIAQQAVVRAR
ncbi:MAG: succinylglutamate desuccinylase/aspartoacylase family protein [Gammaproteobacteria bacterium]|nr:succinylglutamate desuccinylase/aspartoacylase family protein [Gammaproteobacteria bacterium]MDH3857878.1 succinylglutamate desuccinylase/aspartoacylase family protein [Gammaproteobacteria bacterium]